MISDDKALEIARGLLTEEIRQGGLVTMFGMNGRWEVACTFPEGSVPGAVTRRYSISYADGTATQI
jgi:hypothetical protein